MYQNKNIKFVFKLSNKNYKSSKIRNRICIIAIVLTSFMIVSVLSIGASYIDSFKLHQLQLIGTTGMASLNSPTEEQINTLKQNKYIKFVGTRTEVIEPGKVQYHNNVNSDALYYGFRYYDNIEWKEHRLPVLENVIGSYPNKDNEIMIPRWALNKMGISKPQIGQKIEFSYTFNDEKYKKNFTLSGYFNEFDNSTKDYSVVYALVSQQFCNEIANKTLHGEENTLADITFYNQIEQGQIKDLESSLNLDNTQSLRLKPNSQLSIKWEIATALGGVILCIAICGYLLIYNIFNISVTNNVHFYGQLKVIGITGKQIMNIVLIQGLRMALIAIVIGETIGYFFSSFIVPEFLNVILEQNAGIVVNCNIWVLVLAFIFTFVTVVISVIKPALIAGKISPIDSMKYEIVSNSIKKYSSRKKRITLSSLAISNVFCNKKRYIMVVISMALGIVACLLVNVMVVGMDTDAYVYNNMDSDIELTNKTVSLGYEGEFKQVFSDVFLNQLENTKGILDYTSIKQRMIAPVYSESTFGQYLDITGVDSGNADKIYFIEHPEIFYSQLVAIDFDEKTRKLYPGINWNEFDNGNICLIASDNKSVIDIGNKINFKLAKLEEDKVKVKISDKTNDIIVGGYIPQKYNNYASIRTAAPNLFVSHKCLDNVAKDSLITKLMVNVNKDKESKVNSEIHTLINDTNSKNDIVVVSALEKKEGLKQVKITLYGMGGGLSFALAFIGILNFINVIFTSIVERQRELTIMESIGYTKKQIRKMIRIESLLYFISSLITVLTLGNLIIMLVFSLYKNVVAYAVFNYPFVLLLCLAFLLFLVCYIVPSIALKKDFQTTIVERLRLSCK